MIKSRLHRRLTKVSYDVKRKTYSGGTYTESIVHTGLKFHRRPAGPESVVQDLETGVISQISDTFWFEPDPGDSLPDIYNKDVLVDTAGNRFEVLVPPSKQGGENNWLRLETRLLQVTV